jgi:beta-hydroxylase
MFYPPDLFSFTPTLEANWRIIRDELLMLPESTFIPWKEKQLYNTGWDVFGLHGFGKRDAAHCALCPETTRIVESIPDLITAGFSSLKPHTHIQPHVGYSYLVSETGELVRGELNNAVLRGHLGLIIPRSYSGFGCALEVGGELYVWQEGKCVFFEDTVIHQAWNRTDETRVVLLFDFKKPKALATSGEDFPNTMSGAAA